MALLRKRSGRIIEKVEQWVPAPWLAGGGARSGAGVRRDLLGFVDLFVIDTDDRAYGVQCCAMSGRAAHLDKIQQLEREDRRVSRWLRSGLGLELHAWRKTKLFRGSKAVRWSCAISVVTLASDAQTILVVDLPEQGSTGKSSQVEDIPNDV